MSRLLLLLEEKKEWALLGAFRSMSPSERLGSLLTTSNDLLRDSSQADDPDEKGILCLYVMIQLAVEDGLTQGMPEQFSEALKDAARSEMISRVFDLWSNIPPGNSKKGLPLLLKYKQQLMEEAFFHWLTVEDPQEAEDCMEQLGGMVARPDDGGGGPLLAVAIREVVGRAGRKHIPRLVQGLTDLLELVERRPETKAIYHKPILVLWMALARSLEHADLPNVLAPLREALAREYPKVLDASATSPAA